MSGNIQLPKAEKFSIFPFMDPELLTYQNKFKISLLSLQINSTQNVLLLHLFDCFLTLHIKKFSTGWKQSTASFTRRAPNFKEKLQWILFWLYFWGDAHQILMTIYQIFQGLERVKRISKTKCLLLIWCVSISGSWMNWYISYTVSSSFEIIW